MCVVHCHSGLGLQRSCVCVCVCACVYVVFVFDEGSYKHEVNKKEGHFVMH